MRVLKDPFAQFLAAGAIIFLVFNFSKAAEESDMDRRIVIDGPTQEWIYGNFVKQFRRWPTRQEMDALIRAHVEHEVKYREALSMGLDVQDSIVRRRMMQKFDFLYGNAAAGILPDEAMLREWYEARVDEFALPPTVSFSHIWFSPDRRGDNVEADAVENLQLLLNGTDVDGDTFPFDVKFEKTTSAEVRNVLGPAFAEAVFDLPLNQWSGPIRSGLGYHLVLVSEKKDRSPQPFEVMSSRAIQRWREEESIRILEEKMGSMKAGYEVELDEEFLENFRYTMDDLEIAP